MTPDELIAEIFRIQEERDPDADPGDIDITIQDDMPLVVVGQDRAFSITEPIDPVGGRKETYGDSIQQALETLLQEVIDGRPSTRQGS